MGAIRHTLTIKGGGPGVMLGPFSVIKLLSKHGQKCLGIAGNLWQNRAIAAGTAQNKTKDKKMIILNSVPIWGALAVCGLTLLGLIALVVVAFIEGEPDDKAAANA